MEHFGKSHFGTDVSSREHFGTCTIRRCRRSGRWTFQHGNISTWGLFGTRTFRHEEFSAQEHFGTGTFRHGDILAHGHFGTVAQVPKCLCRNVHIALQGAKISMCWNVQVPKYPRGEMFWCWKVHLPERSQCQTVHVLKCSRDEASVQKWLFPKCSRPKWCIGENETCYKTGRISTRDFTVLDFVRLWVWSTEFMKLAANFTL